LEKQPVHDPLPSRAGAIGAEAELHEHNSRKKMDAITHAAENPTRMEIGAQVIYKYVGIEQHLSGY
jgi:hypothetical protein